MNSNDNAAEPTTTATDEAKDATMVVAVVNNPYAQKKPPPELSRKPLHSPAVDSNTVHDGDVVSTRATSELDFSRSSAETNNNDHHDGSRAAVSTSLIVKSNQETEPVVQEIAIQKSRAATADAQDAAAKEQTMSTTTSISLPQWQRLPSRNLSGCFGGSAEILTVAECSQQHGNLLGLYCDRSVRVTGVLLHRVVHSDATVSLVLGDPLCQLQQQQQQQSQNGKRGDLLRRRRPSASLGGGGTRSQLARRGGQPSVGEGVREGARAAPAPQQLLTTTTTAQKTPSGGATRADTSSSRNILQSSSSRNSSSAIAPGLTTMTTTRKRPFSSMGGKTTTTTTNTPMDALAKALCTTTTTSRQQSSVVWVLANPSHVSVDHSVKGDLVMVMGEIRNSSNDPPDCVQQVVAKLPSLQQADASQETATATRDDNKRSCYDKNNNTCDYYYIQARILRNANGTNMKLHTDALMARRKLLRQRWSLSAASASDGTTATTLLRQGCGPPPYD